MLSEELKHWGYHSSISDEGKKQHLEMAEKAEQLEATNAALQERYDMMRQLIKNLRNDLDIPSNETGLRYRVGILIDDNAILRRENRALRANVSKSGRLEVQLQDPLTSPDATWDELGKGFIEQEPDYSEGGSG